MESELSQILNLPCLVKGREQTLHPLTEQTGDERRPKSKGRGLKTHEQQFYRRFVSERQLEETIDWHAEQGASYHILSHGDIDSLTFLKWVLRQQHCRYVILSTWCMALQDIEELRRYIELKQIDRLGSYSNEWHQLCRLHEEHGGRVAMFRNHSKVFVFFGDRFDGIIESSANINTNPRCENTVITINADLAKHYKEWFDGIKSFERNFDEWTKYER